MSHIVTPNEVANTGIFDPRPYDRWQLAMKDAVRDAGELCRLVRLPDLLAQEGAASTCGFPVFAPRGYVARMRPGDPADPLLMQVLPRRSETMPRAGDRLDPVDDRSAALQPGLLQKYHGRVLLVATGGCAVHCRYCFRRHFPYDSAPPSPAAWRRAAAQIAADPSLSEVILSGGDPLTLTDGPLADLAHQLAAIGHVSRLRVHTRLPIMIPERVTDGLISWLTGTRLVPIVVLHANHAAELCQQVAAALARLRGAGVMLLNQAVLLRGVNDSCNALVALSERLVELRVMPYYLHQLDRVAGAGHFEVPEAEGRRLVAQLRERLPGYAVPRYVREIPGRPYKIPLV